MCGDTHIPTSNFGLKLTEWMTKEVDYRTKIEKQFEVRNIDECMDTDMYMETIIAMASCAIVSMSVLSTGSSEM